MARDPSIDKSLFDRTPLPPGQSGAICRRCILEPLGRPLETVRRTAAALMARGLDVERRRSCLSTPGATLVRLGTEALPERMARRFLVVSNSR